MNKVLRHALTGSAIATGMMLAASPAQADCVVTPPATPVAGTVVCGTTITTDTVYTGTSPSVHRQYNVDTSTTAFTGTVSTGAAITGAGLEFVNTVGGTNALNVVNNGSVTNTTSTDAALVAEAIGATPISYTGSGDIINLGLGLLNDGLRLDSSGTGNITAVVGGSISTVGGGTYGIWSTQSGTAGNISITTTAGETITAESRGISTSVSNATSAGTNTIVNAAAIGSVPTALNTLDYGIFSTTAGTGALSVTNNGAIGSATDRVVVNGIFAERTNAGAGALSVTGSGAIFSAGDAILVTNAGTGTTTVNYTGALNVSAGDGIDTTATTGATAITSGAITATAGVGIRGTATTGNISATVNGAVTTSGQGVLLTTAGTKTITVGSAGNVNSTGAADIQVSGAGATTINNNGTIGATSTGTAILATALTDGAITVNNNAGDTINGILSLTDQADTFNNAGNFTITTNSLLFGGNDTVNNNAGGVMTFNGGTIDFGAGTDTFNNSGGTINLTTSTSIATAEAFTTTGTINFAAGTTLTGPAIAFVNGPGGLIDTAGAATIAGFTSLQNNGTIDLAAGTFTVPSGFFNNNLTGIIRADEGATTITGQGGFNNTGIIDLQDGAIGDTLTITSPYAGTGRLQVDVSGNTSDTLVITGSVAGQTAIDVSTIGLGIFDVDGILVVDTTTGGNFDAFVIGEQSGNPLINYDVQQIGNDYFLVTLLDPETAFVPLAATGLLREMWYQSADEVFAQTLAPNVIDGFTVWGQVYGSQRRTGMTNNQVVNGVQYDADNNIEIDRYGVQAGVGYGWGMAEVGLTGGYADAQADGDGEFSADGWNIGIYGRYGGLTGFHAEALFKHDAYDVEFDGLFDGNDIDASSTGIDGSIGYRFPIGVVPSIDVHAGISHVWSDMDGVSAFGFDYDFDDLTSTRGRLGVRGNFGGLYNPYIGATGYHEFSGDTDVTIAQGLFSDSLSTTGKATWLRLEGGLGGGLGTYGLNVAGWVDLGDVRGAGIRAGFRWGGARAMAEPAYVQPAPPPPMAEPAPATQTCADGSVILATEACPPPPPPPAPGERGL